MNPTTGHLEGKLLDYAYGELSEREATTVEAHLRACPQCADSLAAMKQVRRTMSQLPMVPAPQAGLESLMAYAQKAAETARSRPARGRRWLRWTAPLATVAALSVVLVISSKVMRARDATVAPTPNDPRGDRESPRVLGALQMRAVKKSEAARESDARAKEGGPPAEDAESLEVAKALSQWATPPNDWKGASTPAAPEPAAPRPERVAHQSDGTPRKLKVAGTPALKAEPARRGAYDNAAQDNARDEDREARVEDRLARHSGVAGNGVTDGIVGGVVGGSAPGRGNGNTARKQISQDDVSEPRATIPAPFGGSSGADGSQAQRPRAAMASPGAQRLESKPAPNTAGARSPAPSSPPKGAADPEREVAQLRQSLASGAQGQERARLLRKLCETLDALGRTREADSACDTVVREFPASEEAKSALERLKARAAERQR